MATQKKSDVKSESSSEEQRKVATPEVETSSTEEVTTAKTSESEASTDKSKTTTEEVKEVTETPEKAQKLSETEELTEEEKKRLSEKAQKRYRQLDERAKGAEQKAEKLEQEVEKLRVEQENRFVGDVNPSYLKGTNQPTPTAVSQEKPGETQPAKLPWDSTAPVPGEERVITEDDYRRDVVQTADSIVKTRIMQFEKSNQIKGDLAKVESKYPVLNPDSSDYSEELSVKLSKLFEAQLRANSGTKLKTFVDDIMSLRAGGEEKGRSEVTTKLVEQKAEEAVSPSEVTPEPKPDFSELGLEEKEAYMKKHGLW